MRIRLPVACVFWLFACDRVEPVPSIDPTPAVPLTRVAEDPSDAPLSGLPDDLLARFEEGDARFELPFRESQGLGPLYIHRACESCHEDDARGPGAVRRIARTSPTAPLLLHGDVVRPRFTSGATAGLYPVGEGLTETLRLPPAVFARGWLEAIDDAEILAAEARQAAAGDAISGRAARLPDGLGRFGHKARAASLDEFIADALLGDMGLTSPMRPSELPNAESLTDDARIGVDLSEGEIGLLADYVRLLATPSRPAADTAAEALFESVGCASCHVPSMRTRPDYPIAAMRAEDARLYTDVLLHDMGDALADGIAEGVATEREWRTAPLVGLRFLRGLLHDGRAATVAEAIAAHGSTGSEASEVVSRFEALSSTDRDTLVHFVEQL